ncbi:MAG: 16S rRNA (cytidine(1402)-2'-O)-methyltransferase [Xanthomonadales bacterium]|jgi:16S rRNA (cytidine1402-2'-O)-methyltransferase|nr:16S rRNA (cytidine(1402)-2'-O)-methyltransferase [Xanthomonadales bacterium]
MVVRGHAVYPSTDPSPPLRGTLAIVATPIGNLDDLSPRASRTLAEAALLCCEDTRHTLQLLNAHGRKATRLLSVHEHNEDERLGAVLETLALGHAVALVSDAGTPLISDPGYRLVRAALDAGHAVVSVPGPCAAIAALSISGLPSDRFRFEGFLPERRGPRKARLADLAGEPATTILYESAHRILDLLEDAASELGDTRELVVVREISKRFETTLRGSARQLHTRLQQDPDQQRGEFVVLVGGLARTANHSVDALRLARLLAESMPAAQAAKLSARHYDVDRRDLYRALEGTSSAESA